jgi:hypothetical protein
MRHTGLPTGSPPKNLFDAEESRSPRLRRLLAPLAQVDATLEAKVGKIATALGQKVILSLGFESKTDLVRKKRDSYGPRLETTCLLSVTNDFAEIVFVQPNPFAHSKPNTGCGS